jgi:hypothetical protein
MAGRERGDSMVDSLVGLEPRQCLFQVYSKIKNFKRQCVKFLVTCSLFILKHNSRLNFNFNNQSPALQSHSEYQ